MREPKPPVEPPEPVTAALCSVCGGDIYAEELCGVFEDRTVCSDCLESEWNSLTLRERFEAMGYEPLRLGPGARA